MLSTNVVSGRAFHDSQTPLSRLLLRNTGRCRPGPLRWKISRVIRRRRNWKVVRQDDVVVENSLLSSNIALPSTSGAKPVRRAGSCSSSGEDLDRMLRVLYATVEGRVSVFTATHSCQVVKIQTRNGVDVAVDVAFLRF